MSAEDRKESERGVVNIGVSQGFDMRPYSLVLEMKRLLAPIADQGSSMDSGTLDGLADMYLTVGGVEFFISVAPSKSQAAKDKAE
jgi:hypothetical protein